MLLPVQFGHSHEVKGLLRPPTDAGKEAGAAHFRGSAVLEGGGLRRGIIRLPREPAAGSKVTRHPAALSLTHTSLLRSTGLGRVQKSRVLEQFREQHVTAAGYSPELKTYCKNSLDIY